MSGFSVKKPLTVFVAVIAVLVLGVVAYLKMTPDLLPNMDFPYIMITTTYPGANPEKVESAITKPLEQAMATLDHIKEITSTSSENYSMILLEFEDSANLDTISIDIQSAINTLQEGWDDMVSAPYVLKINPSLLPVEVAAVSMDGKDTMALTDFLNDELLPKLEGITGVARVSLTGAISQQLHVVLDQKKIDTVNNTIADSINKKMDEALEELEKTKTQLNDALTQMDNGKTQMQAGKDTLIESTAKGEAELSVQQAQLVSTKAELNNQLTQLNTTKSQLEMVLGILKPIQSALTTLKDQAAKLEGDIKTVLELSKLAETLSEAKKAFETTISQIQADTSLTKEQMDAAITELKSSQAYQKLEADWTQLETRLAALGLSPEGIQGWLDTQKPALDALNAQIDALTALIPEDIDPNALDTSVKDLENTMTQLDQGITGIKDGITQIDSGMLQLKDAQILLSQQKASGLLELANAATELAVNRATVTNALTQVEEGIKTLETTREQTLAKADLSQLLTLQTVSSILTAQNFSMPAGTVSDGDARYMVSVGDSITTLEELEDLLLFDMGMEDVSPIYLKDVANVMVTDNRKETYAKLDQQDSIVLTFEKQSTFATAETTDNINLRFAQLEREYPGLHFVSLMNQGDYIYLIVETILSSLLLGAVFAILILFLFLKDLRPTFITLCSIPISVIFAIVLMYFSGVTINMISLSGLAVAVGMLVDNSVVVIENIYRLRAKGANAIQAAVSGARQVAGAVTASTLTTVCVFAPIVFVEGITRQLFTDLALTMTYALLASLIVSLTLVPAMASGMLRKEKKTSQRWMDKFLTLYEKAAGWSLNHKWVILTASAVLLVVSGIWSISKGFLFMPSLDMPNTTVTISMPEDATMEEAVAYSDEVLARIATLEGIESAGAMMASGNGGLLGGGGNTVTVYITLSDETASGAAMGKQIEALCEDMECTVSASSATMDMSMLTGSGISVNIYANDLGKLQAAAKTAAEVLKTVDGVADTSDGLDDAVPALHISVDRNKAMAKGITVAQLYMELTGALQNSTTGISVELDKLSTSVIIEKPEGSVLTADKLADYPFSVTDQLGNTHDFLLKDVATVQQTTSLSSIKRLNQRQYVTVSAELEEGRNVTLITAQAQQKLHFADLGDGVTYAFDGENEAIMEAIEQLTLMLLLGVLLVYLVMVAQFQSLKSPFIVMFTIPLAFTGGFLGLLLCGMEVSVISLIGFVMLTGIIVNNGIVLVDYINQLRQEGMERRAAILEAGKTRMRPILMTTITTVLGLIDMAVRQSAGTALMRPVAVVCIGGLIYATLMTLFVVPCIYDMVNKKELRTVREEDLKLLDI